MKVWSKQAFAEVKEENEALLAEFVSLDNKPYPHLQIGIIGGGPKGAYAIERLASVWYTHAPNKPLKIVCFNTDYSFGSGPNYQPDQPDYLLVNYSLGNVTFWTDDSEQLVGERESLFDFIRGHQEGRYEAPHPDELCSRSLTGIYLQHCLCRVLRALPETISVQLVPNTVNYIEKRDGQLDLFTETGRLYSFEEVLLSTGHTYSFQDELSRQFKSGNVSTDDTSYVEHIYPITRLSQADYGGKDVLVRGMGLTFVDAVLGLTEGKGGTFLEDTESLTYVPSGKEPRGIFPFSRTGLPMIGREAGGMLQERLRYFTDTFVAGLLSINRQLDFEEEILPVIEKEYRYQFASNLLNRLGLKKWEEVSPPSLEAVEAWALAAYPGFEPFVLQEYLSPKLIGKTRHSSVVEYISGNIHSENRDVISGAFREMSGVWRAIYLNFKALYNFGGLTGESQRVFDTHYFGSFQRVSYGPPMWNMRKILALAAAGILRFDIAPAATLRFHAKERTFQVLSPQSTEVIAESNILVNARIAKSGAKNSHPKIYQHLHQTYQIGLYHNESYRPGCFAITSEGRLPNMKEVTLTGTPTEGVTLDNESLSRTNNNFITPWAKKIIKNYAFNTSQINSYCPFLD
nr:hypothetical protein [Cytophagales bacterium]